MITRLRREVVSVSILPSKLPRTGSHVPFDIMIVNSGKEETLPAGSSFFCTTEMFGVWSQFGQPRRMAEEAFGAVHEADSRALTFTPNRCTRILLHAGLVQCMNAWQGNQSQCRIRTRGSQLLHSGTTSSIEPTERRRPTHNKLNQRLHDNIQLNQEWHHSRVSMI